MPFRGSINSSKRWVLNNGNPYIPREFYRYGKSYYSFYNWGSVMLYDYDIDESMSSIIAEGLTDEQMQRLVALKMAREGVQS